METEAQSGDDVSSVLNVSYVAMEFTAENVERVVKEFYCAGAGGAGGPGAGAAAAYNDWLDRARLSKEAWGFAWELLRPDQSAEVQFFGANALAMKVNQSFSEVEAVEADFGELRQRLVSVFRQYSDTQSAGPKVVQVKLAVALASLMIQSAGPRLWLDPLGDHLALLRRDLQETGTRMLPGFLELLTVLPEEFSTISTMPSQRKAEAKESLAKKLPEVLQLIINLLQEDSMSEQVKKQAVRSLEGWVHFGVPVAAAEQIFDLLLPRVIALCNAEEAEEYLEVITSIIGIPDLHTHPNHVKRMIPKLMSLEQILDTHFAAEDYDGALPLASLFVAVGEHHSRLLLDWTVESEEGKAQAGRAVAVILKLSSTPAQFPTDERISELLFGFWYIFQDDIIACEPQQYQVIPTCFFL